MSPLFFENEQRRSFGQCLLLASELALELTNPLVRRRRRSSPLVKGKPPLLVLGELQPFAFEIRGQLLAIKLGGLGEDTNLLLDRPRTHGGLWFIGHNRHATRLLQPARQVLLADPCLASQLRCTCWVLPGEPLDHLLFERHGELFGHLVVEFSPLRGSTSNDATTILAQGVCVTFATVYKTLSLLTWSFVNQIPGALANLKTGVIQSQFRHSQSGEGTMVGSGGTEKGHATFSRLTMRRLNSTKAASSSDSPRKSRGVPIVQPAALSFP